MDRVTGVRRHQLLTTGALVVLTGTLTVVAGPFGVLVGLVTAGVRYTLGTPYAIAAGIIALLPALPARVDPVSTAIITGGFLVLLLAETPGTASPRGFGAVTICATAVLATSGWLVADTQPLWLAALTICVLIGLCGYVIHRYELVRLDLVDDSSSKHP